MKTTKLTRKGQRGIILGLLLGLIPSTMGYAAITVNSGATETLSPTATITDYTQGLNGNGTPNPLAHSYITGVQVLTDGTVANFTKGLSINIPASANVGYNNVDGLAISQNTTANIKGGDLNIVADAAGQFDIFGIQLKNGTLNVNDGKMVLNVGATNGNYNYGVYGAGSSNSKITCGDVDITVNGNHTAIGIGSAKVQASGNVNMKISSKGSEWTGGAFYSDLSIGKNSDINIDTVSGFVVGYRKGSITTQENTTHNINLKSDSTYLFQLHGIEYSAYNLAKNATLNINVTALNSANVNLYEIQTGISGITSGDFNTEAGSTTNITVNSNPVDRASGWGGSTGFAAYGNSVIDGDMNINILSENGVGIKGVSVFGDGENVSFNGNLKVLTNKGFSILALDDNAGTFDVYVNKNGGKNVILVGDIDTRGDKAHIIDVNMDNSSSYFTGAALMTGTNSANETNLKLSNGATWNMTADSKTTNLVMNASTLNMRASSLTTDTYETLTTDSYTSTGSNYLMDTDLNSESTGDKLIITGKSSGGANTIQVHDASLLNDSEVTGVKNLLLVSGADASISYTGKSLDAGGLWDVTPSVVNGLNALDASGTPVGTADQWYLSKIEKKANKDTTVLVADAANTHASWLWRSTNDTLRERLGDLRMDKNTHDGEGIWARYRNGRYSGGEIDGSYGLFQVGYDKKLNDKAAFGMAFETGSGRANYNYGRTEETMRDFSIYGTWYGKDGVYTDLIGSAGTIEDKTHSWGNYPDRFTSNEHAYRLSLEHGKTIYLDNDKKTFFEPQVQLILGRLGGRSYNTDRNTNVDVSATNSAIGRLGFVLGRKTPDKNDIYLKASVLREFAGKQDINMAAANGEHMNVHNDYGETWWEVGVGGNWNLSKVSHFYLDLEKTFGASVNKTVQLNAGLRFEF